MWVKIDTIQLGALSIEILFCHCERRHSRWVMMTKIMRVMCAAVPQRAMMISQTVWMAGHLRPPPNARARGRTHTHADAGIDERRSPRDAGE